MHQANETIKNYLLQSLNMALGAIMQGETSYTNSFDIAIKMMVLSLFLAYLALIFWMMSFIIRFS